MLGVRDRNVRSSANFYRLIQAARRGERPFAPTKISMDAFMFLAPVFVTDFWECWSSPLPGDRGIKKDMISH